MIKSLHVEITFFVFFKLLTTNQVLICGKRQPVVSQSGARN